MIHYRTCSLCEANCGLEIVHEGEEILSIRGHQGDVLSGGYLCPKATALEEIHSDPDRLRQPMRRDGESWTPVTWEAAIDEAIERLHQIQAKYGRNAVAVYVGNPTVHNYASLLALPFFLKALGSRNRFSATSTDQLPHTFASYQMFGHQYLLPVPDVDRTDLMMIVGGNPLVSNGSIMTAPNMRGRLKAIQQRGGAVVVLDPRYTETARIADEHHFVRPGSDALLFLAMLHVLFADERIDEGAWRSYTHGLETLQSIAGRFAPERVEAAVGMPAETIRRLSRRFRDTPRAVLYGRVGVCTQAFGGLNAWLIHALNLVTGHLDQPGGAMFPSPAIDLAGLTAKLGEQGNYDRWRSRVRDFPACNGELPVSVLSEEIETPGDGQIRALITLAGNPVLSTPDGKRLAKALPSLECMVSLDPYLTATSRHAHLVLPPSSPLARDHFALVFHALSVRNTVKYSPPMLEPEPGTHHDWETLLALASGLLRRRKGAKYRWRALQVGTMRRLGMRRVLNLLLWTSREGPVRGALQRRLTLDKLQRIPEGVDLGPLQPQLPQRLYTPDKTIQLAPAVFVQDVERLEQALEDGAFDPGGALRLIGRRHLRSNNSWMHNAPKMVRGKPRCTLLMHPDDAAERGLTDAERVWVTSPVGEVEALLEISDEVMPGVVSLPHGWGHQEKGAQLTVANATEGVSVNDLTDPNHLDELTGNAGFNGVRVQVAAVGPARRLERTCPSEKDDGSPAERFPGVSHDRPTPSERR